MKLALSVLLLYGATVLAESPQAVAIRNARIVPVSGPVLAKGTVVVRNGLIEAVGESVAIPSDAWILEGQGLTVYPGLIDALSTLGFPPAAPTANSRGAAAAPSSPPAPVARGPEDRPSNTSWVRAADIISLTDRRIESARNAGFTTAVTYPMRGIFAGQGSMINLAGEKLSEMVVLPSAGQYITLRGGGFTSYPGSLMGVIAYIRQIYIDAEYYKAVKLQYGHGVAGQKRPEYDRALDGVLESPRALLPATEAKEIDRILGFAAELKLNAVLYGGHGAYLRADRLKKSGVPVIVNLRWPERPRDSDPEDVDSLRTLELRENAPTTPGVLAKAGVPFAFSTRGIERPSEIAPAVKRAIDAGLTPASALRAFTLTPAEIYGVADRLGSIDKGKIANLIVTDGELFLEKTKVKYLFIDGRKIEPSPDNPATPSAEATQ